MIFSKTTFSIVFVLVLLSILTANFLNELSTYHTFYLEDEEQDFISYLSNKYGPITDSGRNIVWFLQISDIHLSIFRDPGRISQFQQFCDGTVKKISPLAVLATGDLTDAKAKDNLGSSQVKTEWVYYHNIIKESEITEKTVWLDIRGNHDNFNIKTINAKENYFKNYSVQGASHARSYMHVLDHNGVNLAFVGIDACPDPGIRRPFNFVGILDLQEQHNLQVLNAEAESSADHIVWFGHYPTSCILSLEDNSKRFNLRNLIGSSPKSQVYTCGHLHSMGGFVTQMYTKQKQGFLELELSDWKDNRMSRLFAIDHGILSFVDHRHNSWPLVLVTNPKHAQYVMPGREPLHLIPGSTHIRILAFSDVDITTVQISFDEISWMKCKQKEGPLYVCRWLPNLFKGGLHVLHVQVIDELEKETIVHHPFSFDGTKMSFDIRARILLMLDADVVATFATFLLMNVLPLVYLRVRKRPPRYKRNACRRIFGRVWLLSKIDRVFYPIVLYAVYVAFGPWAIGELIDGHIGAIFAWGILIKGVFIPEPFTYMYGSVQFAFVHIPLVFVLAHTLQVRLFRTNTNVVRRVINSLPFVFLLTIQMLLAYFFWLEYGLIAFVFGPLRTWSIGLSLILWYKLVTLPPEYCRKLLKLSELPS